MGSQTPAKPDLAGKRLLSPCVRKRRFWVKTGKAQCEQMFSAVAPIADIAQRSQHVRFVPIVLKKSFWGDERKFLGPLMRFARGDMGDHVVSSKIDYRPSQ